jgi:hypothetical protein
VTYQIGTVPPRRPGQQPRERLGPFPPAAATEFGIDTRDQVLHRLRLERVRRPAGLTFDVEELDEGHFVVGGNVQVAAVAGKPVLQGREEPRLPPLRRPGLSVPAGWIAGMPWFRMYPTPVPTGVLLEAVLAVDALQEPQ